MPLVSGTKLGPYEILSPLGAGGMGEVYRAKDTRLERMVAIKILPAQVSNDPVRKQRFEREAKTISSLNHPHICTLYDIGSQDGVDYLVMECVEGETLAKRLEKGPLPLDQVAKYGAQIAGALDKAHRAGIVHRDLKPGNIMLTANGAKLLDFGLAKPAAMVSGATLTAAVPKTPVTQEGTVIGTFQYMSPEQIEGKELDGRSDIFSLGAVLYEMLTGKKAFEGKTELSVASAILEKEPEPIGAIKPMTPPVLDHVVKKCLAKASDDRWQIAGDLASELKWVAAGGARATSPAAARKSRETLAWLCCAALIAGLVFTAIWWQRSKPQKETMHFYAQLPFPVRDIAIAPNGHTLALVAYQEAMGKNAIWIYELGSPGARSLADTEGGSYPFWSPDSRSLAFFAGASLKRVDISNGQVQTICVAPSGRGGTWNKNGVIVFTPDAVLGGGLYKVLASGGAAEPISKPDASRLEDSHRWPMFLPDGRHYLYLATNFSGQRGVDAIFVGSLGTNEKRFVVEATANAAYAEPGYLLFYRDKTLLAQRFDEEKLAVTGEPMTILSEIEYQPQVKRAAFAAFGSSMLVAQTGGAVALSQLTWFDRKGNELGLVGKPDVYGNVSIAPNERFVAVNKTEIVSQNTDIWTLDLQRDGAKRITFDTSFSATPIWSPDGGRLAFFSNRQRSSDVFMKNSDGAREARMILHDDLDKLPSDWSRDGKYILYMRGTELWLATFPELKTSVFLKTPSVLRNGQFSPDGRWVAYASIETGRWEIYVTSFPEPRGKWQVSSGGGEQPRWRGDGKELFYLSPDGKMIAAPVTTSGKFDAGAPAALFQATPRQPVSSRDLFVYDVSKDGKRFLINTPVKLAETQPMSVVLNWDAELTKK
jgi:eukaryotic-like serine/threonine-protein kinase